MNFMSDPTLGLSQPISSTQPQETSTSPPSSSWSKGIFSWIGSLFCCFKFSSKKTTDSMAEATPTASGNRSSLQPDSNGRPSVKASWSLTSFYNWAMGISYCRTNNSGKIKATTASDEEVSLAASGNYRLGDQKTLAKINQFLRTETQENSASTEIDSTRGCLIIREKKKDALASPAALDSSKKEKFINSMNSIFHQGIVASIPHVFDDAPEGSLFLPSAQNVDVEYEINIQEKTAQFTLTLESHRDNIKTLHVAGKSTPLSFEGLTQNPGPGPGFGKTTMRISATLNEDGSFDKSNLTCSSLEGSWQLGSRSPQTVTIPTVPLPAERSQQISIAKEGIDILEGEELNQANQEIKNGYSSSTGQFEDDVQRGFLHRGYGKLSESAEEYVQQLAEAIEVVDGVKRTRLINDLKTYCHQGIFAVLPKMKPTSALLLVQEGKEVETTFTYKYEDSQIAQGREGTVSHEGEYPHGRIVLEVERKVLSSGSSPRWIKEKNQSPQILDSTGKNITGATYMKLYLRINEEGGVATRSSQNGQNKSGLDATIVRVENRWKID